MTLAVERIGVALGAVVQGVELRKLTDSQTQDVEKALFENQVLFFRGQNLSRDEFTTVAARFGHLRVPQPGRLLGVTDPVIMHERTADSPPRTELWHTDVGFAEHPPLLGFLASIAAPAVGGETAWACTYSMYDALSPQMQDFCAVLKGEHKTHETVKYVRQIYGDEAAERVAKAFPTRLHPLVKVHPKTGRKHVYLGSAMSSIAGLTPAESDLLLGHLRNGLNDMNIQVRWKWTAGDLAMWDQRATMHRVLAAKMEPGERRILQSVFVEQD